MIIREKDTDNQHEGRHSEKQTEGRAGVEEMGAEETVIAGCIGNGKDCMRQEVRVEEMRAWHAEIKAVSSSKKRGLGSRAQSPSQRPQKQILCNMGKKKPE